MTQQALIPAPAPITEPRPTSRGWRAEHPFAWVTGGGWRAARPDRCRRCKTPVLAGLDDSHCAFGVAVDLAPVTAIGEAVLLLQHRPSYLLTRAGLAVVLTRRPWQVITSLPAESGNHDVLPEHRCHQTVPATLTASARIHPPRQASPDPYAAPPF